MNSVSRLDERYCELNNRSFDAGRTGMVTHLDLRACKFHLGITNCSCIVPVNAYAEGSRSDSVRAMHSAQPVVTAGIGLTPAGFEKTAAVLRRLRIGDTG